MDDSVRLRIINIAATVFNKGPYAADELVSVDGNPDLITFTTLLDPALDMAMREYDWSFLISRIEIGDDLGGEGGFDHSYKLPEGLFRLCRVGSHTYKRVGTMLLTERKNPIVYGIMEDFDETAVPRDFWTLVGYALAFMASNSISAGDSKANTSYSLYQKLAQNMMINDAQNDEHLIVDYDAEDSVWQM